MLFITVLSAAIENLKRAEFCCSNKEIISTSTCGWLRKQLCQHFSASFFLQVVKDRVCLRALEKIIYQLADSKEQAEILSATALQPVDVNADGTCTRTHTLF